MATRFYSGQTDYVDKLNELASASEISATVSNTLAPLVAQANSAAASAAVSSAAAASAWAASTAPTEQLAPISKSLHVGTVVNSIIYDTSKDSDGGAWRKRMQDKSWYNEALGGDRWIGQQATIAAAWTAAGSATGAVFLASATAGPLTVGKYYAATSATTATEVTRGISREFPALPLVVAETGRVVIYDGSQSSCPMWMVFVAAGGGTLYNGNLSSVAALNGQLVIGSAQHLAQADFSSDYTRFRNANGNLYNVNRIANRNAATGPVQSGIIPPIVNQTVNDVAITVLDTAPIDPATGLPVPTIAVATAGGVSVIKDDGTVVTIAGQAQAVTASYFDADNRIVATGAYQNELGVYAIPTSNVSYVASLAYYTNSGVAGGTNPKPLGNSSSGYRLTRGPSKTVAVGSMNLGVSLLKENPSSQGRGMVNYITNSYTSGWLPGDIRGAYLADTVAETVTASGELVTNGTFTSDLIGWTLSQTSTALAPTWGSGGVMQMNSDGAGSSDSKQTITTVAGKTYTITITVAGAAQYLYVGSTSGSSNLLAVFAPVGTNQYSFPAGGTSTFLWVSDTASGASSVDNVSAKLAEPDRSVKNKGLIVNGTLTKTAVNSGANLVAYSGFSAANYLEQPYNSDLDFGTGDFCVMGWVNPTSLASLGYLFGRQNSGATGSRIYAYVSASTGAVTFTTTDGTTSATVSGGAVSVNSYSFIVCVKSGANLYLYVNSAQVATATAPTLTLSNTTAVFRSGVDHIATNALSGSLALWRITATAPSADQIAHIYRTELPLFQANAQCTLAGTSTSVTALAYDDVADELHVGTPWGRSEFRDLLRVASEATTTGAITSLSANEGVVLTGGASSGKVYAPAMYLRDELRRKDVACKALGRLVIGQEFTATASQTVFTVRKGYEVKFVYVNGLLKRSVLDYNVTDDGFQETVTMLSGVPLGQAVTLMIVRG